MLRRITQVWRNPEHRTVIANTVSLSGLKIANSVLPLITIPYVVRVIGPSNYGAVAFAQAFAMYFTLVVNYGFDFSASREIAWVREDAGKLSEVFWSVLWTKVALLLGATIVFGGLVSVVPQLRSHWQLMFASYLIVFGYVAFPTWFFQGIEKLGFTAIFNFAIKVLFTGGIFVLLRHKEQFILIPLLMSIGQVFVGCLALVFAKAKLLRSFRRPSVSAMLNQLRTGWTLFISMAFINMYSASNTVILGFFAAETSVGYFAASSKIVGGILTLLLVPFVQASYPHIGKLMRERKDKGIEYLKKVGLVVVLVSIPSSVAVFALAPFIVKVFLGEQFSESIGVLRVLSVIPIVVGLHNLLGDQWLLNLNQDKAFLRIVASGFIVNLGLNIVLAATLKEIGSALSWVLTEVYESVGFFLMIRRQGLKVVDIHFYRQWLFEAAGRSQL